jgi:glucose-6-phosphate dehydrogenase assembly protein OpcA
VSLDVHPVADALAQRRLDSGSMNALTMTLAVFLDDDAATWVRDRAHALAGKHPSRVVLFDATKDQNERSIEPSHARSEWIEIGVANADAGELLAALSLLELHDAPVILLWLAQTFSNDARFLALAQRARATICSSSIIRSDTGALRDLVDFVEHHPRITIQDVAYLRLGTWQELIAGFFDEPECRGELEMLRSVEVTAGSDAEMYYLLGWLASRLEWTISRAGSFTTSSGTVRYTMTREGPPRRLSQIVMRSDRATFTARVHPDDETTIVLDVSGQTACGSRCTPVHTMDLASLIERAILGASNDAVFIESLNMAKHLMDAQPHDA